MSASPPKDTSAAGDADPEEQSNAEKQPGDMENEQLTGPFQDFDVKEQDRWLPIANGKSLSYCLLFAYDLVCDYAMASIIFAASTGCTICSRDRCYGYLHERLVS